MTWQFRRKEALYAQSNQERYTMVDKISLIDSIFLVYDTNLILEFQQRKPIKNALGLQ